ncbi:MAG: SagB/ThcOx family dehydrogenase [Candidatus Heimdallarchaeota archaeon]
MRNNDIEAAWTYHDGTKHPHGELMDPSHRYFPSERPFPFKDYADLPRISLPLDKSPSTYTLYEALSETRNQSGAQAIPDLETLARILFFSAGLTKKYSFDWGDLHMRAASCTGALYHIELYVVSKELPGLEEGVYHFSPRDLALTCLREGNYMSFIREACGSNPQIDHSPLILIATDIYEWNAVKYQTREYRHAYWDSGTIISQILALCKAYQLPATTVLGFLDSHVNTLLNLDTTKEFSLAVIPIGFKEELSAASDKLIGITPKNFPKNLEGVKYPEIHTIHRASSLVDSQELQEWLRAKPPENLPIVTGKTYPIARLPQEERPSDPLEEIMLRRGSTRRFKHASITFEQLSFVFEMAFARNPIYYMEVENPPFLSTPYLIANAVDGLPSGAYVYHPASKQLEQLKEGEYRATAKFLGLNQDLPGDASVTIFFLTNLTPVLSRFGNRGYRLAQLEASILGGRFYLGAYGQNFGATGLTFYDDAVTEFFSPHAKGKSVMFMVSLGKRAKGRFHPGKLRILS